MTIVLNNVRSAWNVGAIMRTCDAFGADIILIGYTPRPAGASLKLIKKTAIGAEERVKWQHFDHWQDVLENFPGYKHFGIEISDRSRNIFEFLNTNLLKDTVIPVKTGIPLQPQVTKELPQLSLLKRGPEIDLNTTMLWFGNEIHGLEEKLCNQLDAELHLPMYGMKESLNVASTVCAVGYLFLSRSCEQLQSNLSQNELPTISVPVRGDLDRNQIYNENSWLNASK